MENNDKGGRNMTINTVGQATQASMYEANVAAARATARDLVSRIKPSNGKEIVTKVVPEDGILEHIGAELMPFGPGASSDVAGYQVLERPASKGARFWAFFDGTNKRELAYVPVSGKVVCFDERAKAAYQSSQ